MAKTHDDIRMIRSVIRLIMIAMMLGFAFLWIVMPTNTYKQKWQPRIKAKVNNSTYFGTQGMTLLLYTSPVLLFATLGCIYIHLGKKLNGYYRHEDESVEKRRLSIWRQPIVVKGPLGIVSSIELSFLVMFVALLVWSLATYLHNSFATITLQSADGEQV